MNNTDVVTVRGLVKRYGGRPVVDGIDLDVRAGEIVGLIGTNGAGKTTTAECIQGLRRPDAGEIRVLGYNPLTDGPRIRSLIGSQLQSAALPDRLRVGEAVRLFAGTDRDDLIEQFGLAERRRSPFSGLSGGEQQRLFLVLALIGQPRLVILDELTQGLDPAARRTVWAAVDRLRAGGVTVLLVTHELDEAEQLCDRVVAMRAGRIIASGTPVDLIDRYGRSATVSFRPPAGGVERIRETIGRLPGVRSVRVDDGRIVATGDRTATAHIGAALVAAGPVPGDLSVRQPTLEDALVHLLETDDPSDDRAVPTLIGAIR